VTSGALGSGYAETDQGEHYDSGVEDFLSAESDAET
jgi:hypothetical protein